MKKSYFEKTRIHLNAARHDKLLELIQLPFDILQTSAGELWNQYKSASESGYTEAAEIHYLKYSILDEAIRIKKGNEEQAWDYLT